MLKVFNDVLLVAKLAKDASTHQIFASTDNAFNAGILKGKGPDAPTDLEIGAKVYFGANREEVIIEGEKLLSMRTANLIAMQEVPVADDDIPF